MDERDWLADRFQQHRPRMRTVAHRMLGSTSEADDPAQEAWIRLSRATANQIDNLDAWLVPVVGRIALNMLRARTPARAAARDALSRPDHRPRERRRPRARGAARRLGRARTLRRARDAHPSR